MERRHDAVARGGVKPGHFRGRTFSKSDSKRGGRGCSRWRFTPRFDGLSSSKGRAGARRRGFPAPPTNPRPPPPGRPWRVVLDAHAANWPVFAPPQWPAFTPPLTEWYYQEKNPRNCSVQLIEGHAGGYKDRLVFDGFEVAKATLQTRREEWHVGK